MISKKQVVQRIVIINAALLFSLLLSEGILRLIPSINNSRLASKKYKSQVIWLDEYTRMFRKNIYHEFEEAYRPEGEKYFKRTQPRIFRTDENGYILGSPTEQNKFAEFKILFSGGSTVECQEVDEPFRFPFAVQSILNEKGLPEIQTSNLGIRGHTTFETIKLMTGTSLFDNFQAILFMHNINDWTVLVNCGSYFSSSSDKISGRYGSLKNQFNKIIEVTRDKFITQSSLAFLLDNLRLKYFSSEILPQPKETVEVDDELIKNIRQIYNKNIVSLAAIASSKKAKAVFLTEPSPFEGGLQEELNDELRKICQVNGYHLIDVAREFPRSSEALFFPDGVHLNNEGSLRVAQIISEKLPYLLEHALSKLPIKKEWLDEFDNMLQSGDINNIVIPYNARYPVPATNIDKLYFQTIFDGKSQVCFIDLETGLLNRLSPFSYSFWHPCPDSNGAVYAVSDCLKGEKIFKLTGQGMTLLPFFDSEDFEGAIPAISPGGIICFPGFQNKGVPDLFMFSIQDNKLRQITATDYEEWRPVFHPDGHRIFYISNKNGNFDIFCYDINENASKYVIGTEGDDWDVDISPCGNLLVFAAKKGDNFDLMLFDINKKKLQQLTSGPGNKWDPRFSPNGKIIMYSEELNNQSRIKFLKVPPI